MTAEHWMHKFNCYMKGLFACRPFQFTGRTAKEGGFVIKKENTTIITWLLCALHCKKLTVKLLMLAATLFSIFASRSN